MSLASTKELIVNHTPTGIEIAILEDGVLTELHHDDHSAESFSVGDVYLGKVRKTVASLKAAFVDIAAEQDAFLHYTDLGPQVLNQLRFIEQISQGQNVSLHNFELEPDINKNGKIEEVLNKRYLLLVQVAKEPISSKGPRLTADITLAGRYVVITPFSNIVGVSKKIKNEDERKRLLRLVESIKPQNFGITIRTAAEGKKINEIREDLEQQLARWESIVAELKKNNQSSRKILSEVSKTSGILRDLLNGSFKRVAVNNKSMAQEIKAYIQQIAPEQENIVSHHANSAIFDAYKVTKQIKASFGKTVTLPSGAYLVVEHTEAMHVIDVNSGHKMGGSGSTQESSSLTVNLEAVEEIARQLRLRDIGGLIVIDFIDLKDPDNKAMLLRRMTEAMQTDRARHTILPLSKFGIMQITRERVRPEVKISTAEVCPSCKGTGKVKPAILLIDEIENHLSYFMRELDYSSLHLIVHPFIEAFLKRGIISRQWQWFWKFKKWVAVSTNDDYYLTEYRFFDAQNEEIRI
jgi:ribonuclease G